MGEATKIDVVDTARRLLFRADDILTGPAGVEVWHAMERLVEEVRGLRAAKRLGSTMKGLNLLHMVASNALDEVRRHLKPDGYRVALVIAHPTDREMDIVVTDADVSLLLEVLRERSAHDGAPT